MNAERVPVLVGILTYHDGFNFGAFLQVYGLQKALDGLGFKSEVIDYKSFRHTFHEYRCLFWTRRISLLVGNLKKMFAFFRAQRRLLLSPRVHQLNELLDRRYDLVVFGSDEIWNYLNPIVKLDPVYFGVGVPTVRRISYAASCGSLSQNSVVPDVVREGWRAFDYIAVRDSNSAALVNKHVDIPVQLVLDPTFLVDFSHEEVQCSKKNFILVYTTGFSSDVQIAIRDYATIRGMRLISVGYRNAFCDESIIGIGPFEFLGYYKASSVVITSMFHGTIFGIKYNKPLAIIVDPYRTNKLATMLNDFELLDRVTDAIGLATTLSEPINYERVNSIVKSSVVASLAYLHSAVDS